MLKFNVSFLFIILTCCANNMLGMFGGGDNDTANTEQTTLQQSIPQGSGFVVIPAGGEQLIMEIPQAGSQDDAELDSDDDIEARFEERNPRVPVATSTTQAREGEQENAQQPNTLRTSTTIPQTTTISSFFTKGRVALIGCLSALTGYMLYNYFINKPQPVEGLELIIDNDNNNE